MNREYRRVYREEWQYRQTGRERVQGRAERGMTMQTDRHGERVQRRVERGVTVQTDRERKYRRVYRDE